MTFVFDSFCADASAISNCTYLSANRARGGSNAVFTLRPITWARHVRIGRNRAQNKALILVYAFPCSNRVQAITKCRVP